MFIKREWATPLVIGASLLAATTGVAMFFEVNTLLGKNLHKFLGLVFVAAILFHITVNWLAFRRHFKWTKTKIIVGIYALLLVVAFFPTGGPRGLGGGPGGLKAYTEASLNAPVADLARIAKLDPIAAVARLRAAGFDIKDASQSLLGASGKGGEKEHVKALGGLGILMKDSSKPAS